VLKSHELEHLTSENFETIVVVATHVKEVTETKLSIGEVAALYCRVRYLCYLAALVETDVVWNRWLRIACASGAPKGE
jgi:hypothetical protein